MNKRKGILGKARVSPLLQSFVNISLNTILIMAVCYNLINNGSYERFFFFLFYENKYLLHCNIIKLLLY